MTELVLILPRESVPGGCDFHGVRSAGPAELEALRASVRATGRYLERAAAEADRAYKQLIPYVVVRDADRTFLMRRSDAGGDARLHHRASIGIGGHLNPVDEGADPLMAGLRREWDEEIEASWEPRFELIGLLNDDSDAVGSVHLGVLFRVAAEGRPMAVREAHKLVGDFAGLPEIAASWEQLESWSRHVAAFLGLVAADPAPGAP